MAIRTPRKDREFSPALRRKIDLARLAVAVEGLWPRLALPLVIAAGYVALSFFGLFSGTPAWLRIAVAAAFAIGLAASLIHLARWRSPRTEDGARRLDLSDPDLHRPLSTLGDRVAGSDPVAAEIWKLHRSRAEQAAARVTVPPPVSGLPALDRYGVRALAVLLLVSGAFVAGDERLGRLSDAFHFGAPRVPPVPPRLDAWVDPPPYTGRAPVFLSGPTAASGVIAVPAGSTVVVRVSPGKDAELTASETLREKKLPAPVGPKPDVAAPTPSPNAAFERRMAVDGDGVIDVRHARNPLARYEIRAIPDRAPSVELLGIEPEEKGQSLRLRYKFDDDYGIARAEAVLDRIGPAGRRTLLPPPAISVSGRLGENESLLTAPESPWAGIRVAVRIRAEDDIGQTAESDTREIVIPQRRFENPVSRALVEQRRNIVLDPDDRRTPQVALDSLLVAPERFTRKSGDFIMLAMASRKLRTARNDADLIALAEYLWETAVAMDEGNLTQAERNLRAIEERLREALERGASQEEIRRLMDEMRQAMNEMLREMMDRAQRDPNRDPNDRSADNNQQTLTQRDLQDMLKRIEELYQQGDTAKAQELLKQLQELLKNLQTARRQNADPRMREMGEAMDELERLQRDQEQLRDETFRNRRERAERNRQRNQQGQQGQRGQQGQQGEQDESDGDDDQDGDDGQQGQDGQQEGREGQQGMQGQNGQGQNGQRGRGLGERQQALRDRLNRLRERMRQNGMGDQEGLGGADEGMGDAEQNLRRNNREQAGRGQQKAIDELGKAGRGMAQQMQREMGDAQGEGEGEGFGPGDPNPNNQRGRAQQSTDPLGRPLPGDRNQIDNSRVKIPQGGNVQGTIGERAQKVLEELRRRLGEIERPRDELEYIERLLRRN